MGYRSILAVYSGQANGLAGVETARTLHQRWGIHVTGLAWHGLSLLQKRGRGVFPQDVEQMLADRDAATVAQIRSRFLTAMREAGAGDKAAFLEVEGDTSVSLAETVRGFDLVIMGRRSNEAGQGHFSARPDVVALRSGRPVIVTPPNRGLNAIPERVVVGWDGKRNSARAALDALPFLTAAAETVLVSVGAAPAEPAGAELAELLRRHGAQVRSEVRPSGRGGAGPALLKAAQDLGAGLLVVGAYEHSKFHEDLMGGATSHLLEKAHLPVLMSH